MDQLLLHLLQVKVTQRKIESPRPRERLAAMGGVRLRPVTRRFPLPEGDPAPCPWLPVQSRVQTSDSCPHRPCHTALLATATAVTTQCPARGKRIVTLPVPPLTQDADAGLAPTPTPGGLRAAAPPCAQREVAAGIVHTAVAFATRPSRPVPQSPSPKKAFAVCHAGAARRAALKGGSSPAAPLARAPGMEAAAPLTRSALRRRQTVSSQR